MSSTVKIDPRDFVTGPFFLCPKCGGKEFGILVFSMSDHSYTRRCRNCWHTIDLPLRELKKKVIYIDQCAISNMMKVLSPEVKGHERALAEPFWVELREALDVVVRLQLVICPDSVEHEQESLASPFFKSLKSTYEHFSGGLSFEHGTSIKMHQVAEAARCFIKKDELKFDFDPQRVVHGRIHKWQDHIRVSVDGILPGTLEKLREARSKSHAGLQKVFERWQKEKKSFAEVFAQERDAYVPLIVQQFVADQQTRMKVMMGQAPMSVDAILPSTATHTVQMVQHIFEMEAAPAKPTVTVRDFFESGLTKELPFNIVESSMFASLAVKAAAGQKEPPNQGTFNDISIVSTLLPYCDAMFVDNQCRALLQDIPKGHRFTYPCAVFSHKTGAEFLKYLREIRDSVTPEHLKTVEELYGPNALKPRRGISGVGEFNKGVFLEG